MDKQTDVKDFNYVSDIWSVADTLYGSGIARSDYNKVILPFTMLRRLECALEPTRNEVVAKYQEEFDKPKDEKSNYCDISKKPFFNTTSFRLYNLGSDNTYGALENYINGFSDNAVDIFKNFKIMDMAKSLDELGLLYKICKRFSEFDLSLDKVSDREMSNIYEHLIQRFGEEIAEGAEDFMTPKDVVRLAVGLLFANDDEIMASDAGNVRTIYDPTMGTGGFLSDALNMIEELNSEKHMTAPTVLVPYGQEVVPITYSMGKASMMLRNVSNNDKDVYDQVKDPSAHIKREDTLSADQFEFDKFDYIVSNPPFGKKWDKEKDEVLSEASRGFSGRFGAGLPSIDDGTMLFMQHVISKMKPENEGGSHAAIITSASPLFTGDAGSGPSNIRRWMFENDFIDCIVKLPDQIFYRTGINTYLWIMNTRKPENRKGFIQLIDASDKKTPLRKNQGNKRYEVSEDDRKWIIKTYIDGHNHGKSVLVSSDVFMYRKVTTQRPLRAVVRFTEDNVKALLEAKPFEKLSEEIKAKMGSSLLKQKTDFEYETVDSFAKKLLNEVDCDVTPSVLAKAMRDNCLARGGDYPLVRDKKGNIMADSQLKDTENIPFGTSFEDYMNSEVLPYAPETWIDESVTDTGRLADGKVGVVGTNISFNRFFYHYEEPRKPEDIATEIRALEKSLDGFMEGLLG